MIPAFERKEEFGELFDRLAELVEEHVDVEKIIEIARKAPSLNEISMHPIFDSKEPVINLGVFRDRTFNFYYQDNIDAFHANGAKIHVIDSISDRKVPDVDALYIGGGFPEIFADGLEKNSSLRESVWNFCNSGKPVYAECGGLMYLGEELEDIKGNEYEMAGFFPVKTEMNRKFQALGYSIYVTAVSNIISRKNDTITGHEFHYSRLIAKRELNFAFRVKRGRGIEGRDGMMDKNTLANYLHIHVISYPLMIKRLIKVALEKK